MINIEQFIFCRLIHLRMINTAFYIIFVSLIHFLITSLRWFIFGPPLETFIYLIFDPTELRLSSSMRN